MLTDIERPEEKREFETVREWAHPDKPCVRKDKPVFTAPGQLPWPCGATKRGPDWRGCRSEEWLSRGLVQRDKKTKEVIEKSRRKDGVD